jgi:thiol-disulfide isomerase/thioredoxin
MRRGLLALAVSAALAIGACSDEPTVTGGGPEEAAAPIGSGPQALRDNAAQADTFIGAGQVAFAARLKALRGHPVVVNQWASWCTSCRFELPFFRAATRRFADRVAFVGLDSQDDRGAGAAFQREIPSGFPSVFDGDASVARDLGGGQGWPTTFFFDRVGELVFTKIGAYATQQLLERDIRRHALAR